MEFICSNCNNKEHLNMSIAALKNRDKMISELEPISKFRVKQDNDVILECRECDHDNLILKGSLDCIDTFMLKEGFSSVIKKVKLKELRFLFLFSMGFILFFDKVIHSISPKEILSFNIQGVLSIIILLTFVTQHEISHFIVGKILGYKPKLNLFSNTFIAPLKREHAILICLAPLLILTPVYVYLLVNSTLITASVVIVALNIVGSKSDIKQAIGAYQCPKGSMIFGDFIEEVRAYSK